MGSHILGLGEIGRPRILRCVQVIDLNNNPVRYVGVHVSGVIIWRRLRVASWEKAGERIDPRA